MRAYGTVHTRRGPTRYDTPDLKRNRVHEMPLQISRPQICDVGIRFTGHNEPDVLRRATVEELTVFVAAVFGEQTLDSHFLVFSCQDVRQTIATDNHGLHFSGVTVQKPTHAQTNGSLVYKYFKGFCHPPCSVEMNRIRSLGCMTYFIRPSSSQSTSLIKHMIPGRLVERRKQMITFSVSVKKWCRVLLLTVWIQCKTVPGALSATCLVTNQSSLKSSGAGRRYLEAPPCVSFGLKTVVPIHPQTLRAPSRKPVSAWIAEERRKRTNRKRTRRGEERKKEERGGGCAGIIDTEFKGKGVWEGGGVG